MCQGESARIHKGYGHIIGTVQRPSAHAENAQNRHSPSGLPPDWKFARFRLLIEFFGIPCGVHPGLSCRKRADRALISIISARHPYFAALRINLSSRFRSLSGGFKVTHMSAVPAIDGWQPVHRRGSLHHLTAMRLRPLSEEWPPPSDRGHRVLRAVSSRCIRHGQRA
jgi:hypothetical protein